MCAMPESSFGKGLAYTSIPPCDDTELRTQAHFSDSHSEGAFDWIYELKGLLMPSPMWRHSQCMLHSPCIWRVMSYLALKGLCVPDDVRGCLIWLEPVKDVEPYVVDKFKSANCVRISPSSQRVHSRKIIGRSA